MNLETDLLKLRNKIDKIDNTIIKKIFERNCISKKIAQTKIYLKKNVKDNNREKKILSKICNESKKYNISKKCLKKIFEIIIYYSIKIQKKVFLHGNIKKISLLGPKGTYSYYVTKKYCDKNNILHKILSYKTFEDAAKSVENNISDISILPLENSNTGKIKDVYNILLNTKLFITEVIYLQINHCLLSNNENIEVKQIKKIYTHIQPFLQCEKFIKKFCTSNIKFTKSTSSAIRIILKKREKHVAAIASSKNVKLFNLKILKKNIQNNKKNFTKFIMLKKNIIKKIDKNKKIVLIRFKYTRDIFPSDILLIMHKENINIQSLKKYKNKSYTYFMEILNSKILKLNIKQILKKISKISENVRIIGNYNFFLKKNF
ncbi:prephenate dehydratase domain-containing protein [Buchnera aphidicola (Chaitoregma tattakana)]|uniref:prephenate dehydratase domain-containing protein n=1 Tax=Buchnera aphidicola TaxID=9 RepID=UPI0031B858C7